MSMSGRGIDRLNTADTALPYNSFNFFSSKTLYQHILCVYQRIFLPRQFFHKRAVFNVLIYMTACRIILVAVNDNKTDKPVRYTGVFCRGCIFIFNARRIRNNRRNGFRNRIDAKRCAAIFLYNFLSGRIGCAYCKSVIKLLNFAAASPPFRIFLIIFSFNAAGRYKPNTSKYPRLDFFRLLYISSRAALMPSL